ncbi:hypothetical protein OG426_20275 [Streptomyces canus]|uniref:hypothetical protein n=1 Tax=Streptomyces canus TaxID=58343 RepID=UPI00386AD556|nr:hypothetical protein OG426_20275 [Streptomyces canus]
MGWEPTRPGSAELGEGWVAAGCCRVGRGQGCGVEADVAEAAVRVFAVGALEESAAVLGEDTLDAVVDQYMLEESMDPEEPDD